MPTLSWALGFISVELQKSPADLLFKPSVYLGQPIIKSSHKGGGAIRACLIFGVSKWQWKNRKLYAIVYKTAYYDL